METTGEQVKFYHNFSSNQFKKTWDKVIQYAGFGLMAVGLYGIVKAFFFDSGEFTLQVSYFFNIVNGVIFYLLGSGRLAKEGKHFFKITDTAISYKLFDGGVGEILIAEITNMEFAKSYFEFTLQSGKQIRFTHNTLPYSVIRAVQEILQPMQAQLAASQDT